MEDPLHEDRWIDWTRTSLEPGEREELLSALTPEQRAHLLAQDYVWVEGVGIVWRAALGAPEQRARFTHGYHFRTRRGEFHVDVEGHVRELSQHPVARAA